MLLLCAHSKRTGGIETALQCRITHTARCSGNRASSDVGIDPLPLQGKLAIVTGGGRGIGAAVARALAQRGCRVLITYRSNVEAAADTMLALPGDGHGARQCDVTDADAVAQLFEDLGESVDIVMNNAAIYEESHFLDSTFDDWQRVWRDTLDANLVGPANVIFHAGRSMAWRGGGVIVCVSSRGPLEASPRHRPTARAKRASTSYRRVLPKLVGTVERRRRRRGPGICGHGDGAMGVLVGRSGAPSAATARSTGSRAPTRSPRRSSTSLIRNAKWSSGAIIDVNGAKGLRS